MNWVGGARSRLRMKYEKKQQKDYFERKRYSRQVKMVRPLSPGATHRKGGISQDLLYLQTLNTAHSMDKKGSVSAPSSRQVNKVDLSKVGSSFPMRRQENLELPNMSPDYSKTPSLLQLADPADSKPPCQHYLSYDDWLTRSSEKVRNDTPDSAVPMFDESTRLSAAAPHTSNRGMQSHGTPFMPYTTPGPKSHYKDPFSKFASSLSQVKFEEGTHTHDQQHGHNIDPGVTGIVNLPYTPGSSHKMRKLVRIPSSGRSVRTPSTFSSSSQSSLGSPVRAGTQNKSHEEEHRPILLQQNAQSERPSLHNWLSSISRDTEKSDSDTHPNKTTPSTADGETLPAGKRRKLDFGETCSTDVRQQRAAVICGDIQAQPLGERDLKLNTWDAVYREETTDQKFSLRSGSPATMKQNTDQTHEKTTCQKGYQATLQNLMSMPLTWANQQPTESKQKEESSAVAEEAFCAASQQFTPGSAPRTDQELNTPTKDIAKRAGHEDGDTHQDEVSTPHIRDPFSPLSSQGSLYLSSGVESLSSLDLSETSEEEVNLSQEELQTLEEALNDSQSTLMGVPKTAAEVSHNADTSWVERDVSDCLQLLLTLVECEDEIKPQDGLVTCPTTTSRWIPAQVGATQLVGSEYAVVEPVSCPGTTEEMSHFVESEVLVKEVIDIIIIDALDKKMLAEEEQYKTLHTEGKGEGQGVIAEWQDDVKTRGSVIPPPYESEQFDTEIREEKHQKDQQMQTVTETEDTGMQTEVTTDNYRKSEMEMSRENEQDTCGSLGKSSSWSDKSTQTGDQEGSVLQEESACEVEECELKARAVLEKVRGLPEPCRREKQLLMMLNDVEELIVKLESAHILQSLKEGTST